MKTKLTLKLEVTSFVCDLFLIKTQFNFLRKIQKGYHMNTEIAQTVNFHDKFDVEGQGQGHQFSNPSETFQFQINTIILEV